MWQTLLVIGKSDSQATYIVETGKNLTMQLTEHTWAPRNGEVNNHIADNHYLYRWTIKSTGTLHMPYVFYRLQKPKRMAWGYQSFWFFPLTKPAWLFL